MERAILTTRRGLITGLVSLVAAPAIVRASSIMPVKALPTAEELLSAMPLQFPPMHAIPYPGWRFRFEPSGLVIHEPDPDVLSAA